MMVGRGAVMAFSPKAPVTVSQQHSLGGGGVITDPYTMASSP